MVLSVQPVGLHAVNAVDETPLNRKEVIYYRPRNHSGGTPTTLLVLVFFSATPSKLPLPNNSLIKLPLDSM